jgi:hypothetical protein
VNVVDVCFQGQEVEAVVYCNSLRLCALRKDRPRRSGFFACTLESIRNDRHSGIGSIWFYMIVWYRPFDRMHFMSFVSKDLRILLIEARSVGFYPARGTGRGRQNMVDGPGFSSRAKCSLCRHRHKPNGRNWNYKGPSGSRSSESGRQHQDGRDRLRQATDFPRTERCRVSTVTHIIEKMARSQ